MNGPLAGGSLTPELRHRVRLVFFAFLLTFIAARIVVFLIMAHRMPDLYLHMGGTHVHHLNYGIFLLSGVGAYLLFAPATERGSRLAATVYGIGLALTFDEFGMWVHLGGAYWQRASFDAVIVLLALLGLAAFLPPPREWPRRRFVAMAVVLLAATLFYFMLAESFRFAARIAPRFQDLEQNGPT